MRLLDLFCGAGGASMGYANAGFEVVGVDLEPQPNYPFEFHQANAIEYPLEGFDAIHASPPCQRYSVASQIHNNADEHPHLLPLIRVRLQKATKYWVIENVPGAPMTNYVILCGLSFGLGVKRHRLFETSFMVWNPPTCPYRHDGDWVSVFGNTVLERGHVAGKAKGGGNTIRRKHLGTQRGREAMGIDWMNRNELSQSIPPAYTQWLGEQILADMEMNGYVPQDA